MQPASDTIVAVATPPGRGGVGIVRVSGPDAPRIAAAIVGTLPAPRRAAYREFRDADGTPLDRGLALWFAAPQSYTGEHVLELHGHGGPVVMDLLVRRALGLGARLARPGEFSERAYLNDRLDLAQAEAVADLIDAGSAAAARAALRSLAGEFSARVHALADALVELRTYVEAAIDFPDEEIDFLAQGDVEARVADLHARCEALERSAEQGRLLHEGCTLVIAGRPNAGKSSLLNALAGHDAAIVTAIPGTTRDVLRERIQLDGLPVEILDTAGLRESPDVVEAEGIRRARHEMQRADRILYVVDAADAAAVAALEHELATLPPRVPVTVVWNKCDLAGAVVPCETDRSGGTNRAYVRIAATSGFGLDALREHLKHAAGFHPGDAGTFSARRRHLDALARAKAQIQAASVLLRSGAGGELVAEELRLAHRSLGEITGTFTSEDLLGKIFASFCIGK
jgi:tRNA modification GTPase